MTILCPDVGEAQALSDLLNGGTLENWTLKLFKNDVTPAESDTAATYTVADFTDYANKTLNRTIGTGAWSTPSTSSGTTSSSYNSGSPQSWTCGATGNTIYGYYYVGATSTVLILAERFGSSYSMVSGTTLTLVPRVEFD